MNGVAVVIPTRDRPRKLEACLKALELAQAEGEFPVYVADSSPAPDVRAEVERRCARFPFARLHHHDGMGVPAARNRCAAVADAELLVNVDDDVYVYPDAIRRLVEAFERGSGWRVVAGSVDWGDEWTRPRVMRRIGWGRPAHDDERPDFLVGAFFAYPRALALALPWNERMRTCDDIFMGALWRSASVSLEFEPNARARHDDERIHYGVDNQEPHIYTNLFDALIANRSVRRASSYELLGFASGAKAFARSPAGARAFLRAWYRGHRSLARDWPYLKSLVSTRLPPAPQQGV